MHCAPEDELSSIRDILLVKESEESWKAIANALDRLKDYIQQNSAESPKDVVAALRSLSQPIIAAITSERTRLSGVAVDLLSLSAAELAKAFDPLLPLFIPTLLSLCMRPNKVFLSRGRACLNAIISSTQSPAILPFLTQSTKDKSVVLRVTVAEVALTCLNSVNPPDLEKESRARDIETLVKATATDASAEIRQLGRQLFEAYKQLLPRRVESFTAPLTPTIRKYLDIRPTAQSSSQPNSRPSSALAMNSSTNTRLKVAEPSSSNGDSSRPQSYDAVSGSSHGQTIIRGYNLERIGPRREAGRLNSLHPDASQSESAKTHPVRSASAADFRHSAEVLQCASRTATSSSMPPPDIIPQRTRSTGEAAHDSKGHPVSPPIEPRPRSGPLRPTFSPGWESITRNLPEEMARRPAVGARRVLRPDPFPDSDKSHSAKGPVRPDTNDSMPASSVHPTTVSEAKPQPPSQARAQSSKVVPPPSKPAPLAGADKRVPAPPRPRPIKNNPALHEQVKKPAQVTGSRVTKPTLSQIARMKANATEQQRSTKSTERCAQGQPKRSNRGSQPKTATRAQSPAPSLCESAVNMNLISASLIPLPPSPTGDSSSIPEEFNADFDAPSVDVQTRPRCISPPPSTSVPAPATPTPMRPMQNLMAQQTPISALVDSIRNEFGLPHMLSDTRDWEGQIGDRSSDTRQFHVSPLVWGRKNPHVQSDQ